MAEMLKIGYFGQINSRRIAAESRKKGNPICGGWKATTGRSGNDINQLMQDRKSVHKISKQRKKTNIYVLFCTIICIIFTSLCKNLVKLT